jgi:hypothetical protein
MTSTIAGMRRLLLCSFGISLAVAIACGSEDGSTFGNGGGAKEDAGDIGSSSGSSGLGDPLDSGVAPDPPPTTDVEAVVTSDNAFSFGYGSETALNVFIQGEGSDGPAIFNCPVGYGPVRYTVPAAQAPAGAFLYIVAWADESTTQGTLAQFKRLGGTAIYSGDGKWEVCATGEAFSHLDAGPDQQHVNGKIADCNSGASGTSYSKGWVTTAGALTPGAIGKLAFGESNDDAGGDFPIVCQKDEDGGSGIDGVAKWMWFDPQDGTTPFVGNAGNRTKTFLIFRLPASALPPPPVK